MQKQSNRVARANRKDWDHHQGADQDLEGVIEELEKASYLIQSDVDIIDSMSLEEVQEESKKLNMALKPMPEKLVSLLNSLTEPSQTKEAEPSSKSETVEVSKETENKKEGMPKVKLVSAKQSSFAVSNYAKHFMQKFAPDDSKLPLVIWAAAVVVLTANVAPIFQQFIFGSLNTATSWFLSTICASFMSLLLTVMIGRDVHRKRDKNINRSGFVFGLTLTLAGGAVWFFKATDPLEKVCAGVLIVLDAMAILLLEQVAYTHSPLELGLLVNSNQQGRRNSPSLKSRLDRVITAVQWRKAKWEKQERFKLEQGLSTVFLICVASLGITYWQYQTSQEQKPEVDVASVINVFPASTDDQITHSAKDQILELGPVGPTTSGFKRVKYNVKRETIVRLGEIDIVTIRPSKEESYAGSNGMPVTLDVNVEPAKMQGDGKFLDVYIVITADQKGSSVQLGNQPGLATADDPLVKSIAFWNRVPVKPLDSETQEDSF